MRFANQLKIAVFMLFTFIFTEGNAKELKLSKNIVYIGDVLNKQPSGNGFIKCIDPKDKENPTITLEGIFENGKIINAKIKTKGHEGFAISGSLKYNVETDGDKNQFLYVHSTNETKIIYSHNNIKVNGSEFKTITINGIDVSFRFDKKVKTWDYQLTDKSNAVQESIVQTIELSDVKFPSELYPFDYKSSNLSQSLCPILISKSGLVQNGAITYRFSNSDEYCNGNLKLKSGGFYNIEKDEWDGYREFPEAVVRKNIKDQNIISIEYKNGDLFEGIINNTKDFRGILGYNASFAKIKLWEGTGKVNGKPEKWIKGESLTQRHSRLSRFLDDDLVLKVEQDSISEDQGREEMRRREVEKKRLEEEERKLEKEREHQETIDEMSRYWGKNRRVVFEGKVSGATDTDNILRAMFGFDHTFFQGTAVLALDDARNGVFAILVEPSQKAYSQGRGRALQVASFCEKEFTKNYNGEWEIRGNKIFIDGNECGTISRDGSTVTYSGMVSSTMKLTRKTTESAY